MYSEEHPGYLSMLSKTNDTANYLRQTFAGEYTFAL